MYPYKYNNRQPLNLRLGIKSSFNKIRNAIALAYCCYIANDKKHLCIYSKQDNDSISIDETLKQEIELFLGGIEIDSFIKNSSLFLAQLEHIQVTFELLFGLGRINFVNQTNNSSLERTGGKRYQKQILFSSQIRLLDIIITSYSKEEQVDFLLSWLKDTPSSNKKFEIAICEFLTILSERCIFKLKFKDDDDLYFQQEGIIKAILESDNHIAELTKEEVVGTLRVFNSFVNEELHRFISKSNGGFTIEADNISEATEYLYEQSVKLDLSESRYFNETKQFEQLQIEDIKDSNTNSNPLQQIYFGAPGTGKSHAIDGIVTEQNSVRTTFHPDSDYSTFVGCYKPCKIPTKDKYSNVSLEELIDKANEITSRPAGDKVGYIIDFVTQYAERLCQIVKENEDIISLNNLLNKVLGFSNDTYLSKVISKTLEEQNDKSEITYKFRPQAFTDAYVKAWKNLEEPYYLVIEEINRGNCAQIFGDIFQLLDRDSNTGYSSYKITPDKDLQEYLCKAFADANIYDVEIKQGKKMQLPCSLNILATMNTSDQSLFPIDSAFKRRWDWKYIPIDYTDNGHYIACGYKKYKWTEFLETVNNRIESVTQSEDKKMGDWFVKPNGNEISADKFVSKVIFYLWNDVFKDFSHDGNTIFKEDFNKFHKFFDFKGDVKLEVLEKFLLSLGLTDISGNNSSDNNTDDFDADYDESISTKGNDYSMYSLNGNGRYNKGEVAFNAIKMFTENNSAMSANDIYNIWANLNIPVSNLVLTETLYYEKKNKSKESSERFEKRYNVLKLNDNSIIYISKGYTLDTITQFMNIVNRQSDWNIHIERVS